MVAPFALISWVFAAVAGSTFIFQTFIKPKLPVYKLQIDQIPRLRYVAGQWKTQLPIYVTLQNENYVPIEIHAINFDLFYTDWWDGSLQLFASVQDRHQQHLEEDAYLNGNGNNIKNMKNESTVRDDTNCSASPASCAPAVLSSPPKPLSPKIPPPIWKIPARSHFEHQDDMFMGLASPYAVVLSAMNLIKQFVNNGGYIIFPSTGVAHVMTQGISATVFMICDNVVDPFQLVIEGLACTLQDVQPGWANLPTKVVQLRNYMQSKLRAFPQTGGVHLQVKTKEGGFSTKISESERKDPFAAWKALKHKLMRDAAIEAL